MSSKPSSTSSPLPLSTLPEWGGVTLAIAEVSLAVGENSSALTSLRCIACRDAVFEDPVLWKSHIDTASHVAACGRLQLDRFGFSATPRLLGISPKGPAHTSLGDPLDSDLPPTLRAYQVNQTNVLSTVSTFAGGGSGDVADQDFAQAIRNAIREYPRSKLEELTVWLALSLVTEMQKNSGRPRSTEGTPTPEPRRRPTRLDAFTLENATAPPSCDMRGMPPPSSLETLVGSVPPRLDSLTALTIPLRQVAMPASDPNDSVSRIPSAKMASFKASVSEDTRVRSNDNDNQSSTDEELNDARTPHRNDFSMSTSAALEDDGAFATLNEYVLLEPIGSGATGEVIKALKGSAYYAIKRIDRSKVREAEGVEPGTDARAATIAEVHALSRLHHRHVVRVVECIDDPTNKEIFLVMEYVDGGAVAKVDQTNGNCSKVTPVELRILCTQMASALHHMHDSALCHGDIKPDNILVTRVRWNQGDHSPGATSPSSSAWQSRASTPLRSPTSSPRHRNFDGPTFLLADFGVASAVLPASPVVDFQSFRGLDNSGGLAESALTPSALPPYTARDGMVESSDLTATAIQPTYAARSHPPSTEPRPRQDPFGSRTPATQPTSFHGQSIDSSSRRLQVAGSMDSATMMSNMSRLPASVNRLRSSSSTLSQKLQLQSGSTNFLAPSFGLSGSASTNRKENIVATDDEVDDEEDDDARRAGFAKQRGRVTAMGGTLSFDAPELFDGAPRSRASDMYALGASLFAMLVGRVPFFADSWGELKTLVKSSDVEFPPHVQESRRIDPTVDLLCSAITELMDKTPSKRLSPKTLFSLTRERSTDSTDFPGAGSNSSVFDPPTMPKPILPAVAPQSAPIALRGRISQTKLPDRLRRHVLNATPSTLKAMRRVRTAMRDAVLDNETSDPLDFANS